MRLFPWIALATVCAWAGSAVAQPGPVTSQSLFDYRWIGDVQLSPDGQRLVFVRTVVDTKRTGYETSLWMMPADGSQPPRPLTRETRDRAPRWSPDSSCLAFLRGPDSQLVLLSMEGGEARKLTDLPRAVGTPIWSPDGSRLAFLSDAPGQPPAEGRRSDVQVVRRAQYRADRGGYLEEAGNRQIWTVDVKGGKPRRLSDGPRNASEVQFRADGSELLYVQETSAEAYYEPPELELRAVPVQGGTSRVLQRLSMQAYGFRLSPDGKTLAFHGYPGRPVLSYAQPDLWTLDLSSQRLRNLTADYDFDMGGQVSGDQPAPIGGGGLALCWSEDGRRLYDVVARQGRAALVAVDAQSGRVEELTPGEQAVQGFSRSRSGTTVVKLSTPTMINELFRLDGGRLTGLTRLNSSSGLTPPEEFNYRSFDGRTVQAWIQKPPDFQPGRKYPLILNIHGGPHAAYGWVFDHEFQLMAARGYVVLYPNPRGSTSYGQEFGNLIQYQYPGDDYKDLMAGVDALLARGYIDEKRLGVTGGSGGGLLTNWTVAHTDRFQAAVSQRDVADWADWWYSADMIMFQPEWFRTAPFEDPAEFARRSPISYVKSIKTPLMFILGDADLRTPPGAGGEKLFRALKYLRRPTVMVRFPRESHDLSRSGEPWHRVERLEHILGWFDKWLLGKSHPEYDEL